MSVYGDLCAPPSRRADSPKETNEAETGLDAGAARPEISRDFEINTSLSSAVCAAARSRAGAEIQNLAESNRLAVFGHVTSSYILIVGRDSRALLYIPCDLSLFGCRRGCSEEHVDSGKPKSFRIYRLAVSVHGDLCAPPSCRADSPKEINEAERPGWMRGSYFSLFGCLRGGLVEREDPGRRSKIFQSLYVTGGVKILIIHRAARAI